MVSPYLHGVDRLLPAAPDPGRGASHWVYFMNGTSLNFFTSVGDAFGAGIVGKGFSLALDAMVDLRLRIFDQPASKEDLFLFSEKERDKIYSLSCRPVSPAFPSFVRGDVGSKTWLCPADWPRGDGMQPGANRTPRGPFIAHVVFEFENMTIEEVQWLKEADIITTASNWCADILKRYDVDSVETVHQGVALDIFNDRARSMRLADIDGAFVFFAGGKYEYRKGVDLSIAAFSGFVQNHPDALLMLNCFNPWPWTQRGLRYSPHFRFLPVNRYPEDLAKVLIENNIPPKNFHIIPPCSQTTLAAYMNLTDCGLFPIRAEGGTNLLLMEYMACGKPLIATLTSGLKDVLKPGINSLSPEDLHLVPFNSTQPEPHRGMWHEATVEELISLMEYAYYHRDETAQLACQGMQDIHRFGWQKRAKRLLELIGPS